jgi:hypothetical protein
VVVEEWIQAWCLSSLETKMHKSQVLFWISLLGCG